MLKFMLQCTIFLILAESLVITIVLQRSKAPATKSLGVCQRIATVRDIGRWPLTDK